MIKESFAILAGSVVVDKATNNLSIFNQIDEITAERLPIRVISALLVVFERDDNDEFDGKLTLSHQSPGGKVRSIGEFVVDFRGKKRTRLILNFQGFPIDSFGSHGITMQWASKSGSKGKTEVTFDVKQPPAPQPQPSQPIQAEMPKGIAK